MQSLPPDCRATGAGEIANIALLGVDRQTKASKPAGEGDSLRIRLGVDYPLIGIPSNGNQQNALFARALISGSKLLRLDESTHGVDVGAKAEIVSQADDVAVIVAALQNT